MAKEEMVYTMLDYLGQMVSVPESQVEAFRKEQDELEAKYGNKLSPEMEKRMAASRERSKGTAEVFRRILEENKKAQTQKK